MATWNVGLSGVPHTYSSPFHATILQYAKDGDVVLIEPGRYDWTTDTTIRKRLIFKAHTDDRINNPVIIRNTISHSSSYGGGEHIQLHNYPMVSGEIIFEDIWFTKHLTTTGGGYDLYGFITGRYFGDNCFVLFNRCKFNSSTDVTWPTMAEKTWGYPLLGTMSRGTIEFRNCTINKHHDSNGMWGDFEDIHLGAIVHMNKCRWYGNTGLNGGAPQIYTTCDAEWDFATADYVLETTAGYGWESGDEVYPIEKCRIKGIVEDDGVPQQADVRLYASDTGALIDVQTSDGQGIFEFDTWGWQGEEFSLFVRPTAGEPIVISRIVPQDPNPSLTPPAGDYDYLDYDWMYNPDTVISDDNMRCWSYSGSWRSWRGQTLLDEGKWYWEVEIYKKVTAGTCWGVGVVGPKSAGTDTSASTYLGNHGLASVALRNNGYFYWWGTSYLVTGAYNAEKDVIGVAIDVDRKNMWWSINGVWFNAGDPENGTGLSHWAGSNPVDGKPQLIDDRVYPCITGATEYNEFLYKTDPNDFSYPAPTGFNPVPRVKTPKVFQYAHIGHEGGSTGPGLYAGGVNGTNGGTTGDVNQSNIFNTGGDYVDYRCYRAQRTRLEVGDVGKYYWEVWWCYTRGDNTNDLGSNGMFVGMFPETTSMGNAYVGYWINTWGWRTDGQFYYWREGIDSSRTNKKLDLQAIGTGYRKTMCFAYDAELGKVWCGADGVWANGGNPEQGTNPTLDNYLVPLEALYVGFSQYHDNTYRGIFNFGDQTWGYTVPAGFTGIPRNDHHINDI